MSLAPLTKNWIRLFLWRDFHLHKEFNSSEFQQFSVHLRFATQILISWKFQNVSINFFAAYSFRWRNCRSGFILLIAFSSSSIEELFALTDGVNRQLSKLYRLDAETINLRGLYSSLDCSLFQTNGNKRSTHLTKWVCKFSFSSPLTNAITLLYGRFWRAPNR